MKTSLSLSCLIPLTLLSLCLSVLPSAAFPLRGQLAPGDHLSDLTLLGPSVKVHLNRVPITSSISSSPSTSPSSDSTQGSTQVSTDDESSPTSQEPILTLPTWNSTQHSYITLIKRDGSFLFPELQAGTYQLTLAVRTHNFHQYRIDVPMIGEMSGWGQHKKQKVVQARTWLPGQPASASLVSNPLPVPLVITAISKHEFFQEPEGFNPKALLANPMMLMAGAAMLLTYIMPKIMAQMDPEAAAEISASQISMQKKMAALQSGNIGGFLSEANGGEKKNSGKQAQLGAGGKKKR